MYVPTSGVGMIAVMERRPCRHAGGGDPDWGPQVSIFRRPRRPLTELEWRSSTFFVVSMLAALSEGFRRVLDGTWWGAGLVAVGLAMAIWLIIYLLKPVDRSDV
jgi:hypothetical protein